MNVIENLAWKSCPTCKKSNLFSVYRDGGSMSYCRACSVDTIWKNYDHPKWREELLTLVPIRVAQKLAEPPQANLSWTEPLSGIYKHYKGGRYRLLFIVDVDESLRREDEDTQAVVYVSLTHGTIKVRPLRGVDGWLTPTAGGEPRFTREET